MPPRRSLPHPAAAQAARAHEEARPTAAHRGVHLLEVRPPEPLRLVVGVAHVVADGPLLAADVARARHGLGWVARRPGACKASYARRGAGRLVNRAHLFAGMIESAAGSARSMGRHDPGHGWHPDCCPEERADRTGSRRAPDARENAGGAHRSRSRRVNPRIGPAEHPILEDDVDGWSIARGPVSGGCAQREKGGRSNDDQTPRARRRRHRMKVVFFVKVYRRGASEDSERRMIVEDDGSTSLTMPL